MLAAQRGNPGVVLRNSSAGTLQFSSDDRIVKGCSFGDIQNLAGRSRLIQPSLIFGSVFRLRNAEAVFAEYDNGNRDRIRFQEIYGRMTWPLSAIAKSATVSLINSTCLDRSGQIPFRSVGDASGLFLEMAQFPGEEDPRLLRRGGSDFFLYGLRHQLRQLYPRSAAIARARRRISSGI